MPATRDGKTWRSQFYYEDWQGVRHKKNKRGFKTKAEAEEWERNFRQQQKQRSGSVTSGNSREKIWILTLRILLKSISLMWRTGLEKAQSRIKDMCLI